MESTEVIPNNNTPSDGTSELPATQHLFPLETCPPKEIRTLEIQDHLGLDSLPEQLIRKKKARGYNFNVMCVGETGIGKSTLMETLFDIPMGFQASTYELKTVELRMRSFDIREGGVKVKLTIVETAGYGDQLDKESSANVIADHISKQYELYFQEECKIDRKIHLYQDTKIHACLYFISPTGHGLKAVDMITLQKLSSIVNVIPVIAKSDTVSKDELKKFKAKIMNELENKGVPLYRFPEDDETTKDINAPLNACVPFAVVGSTDFVNQKGRNIRARQYPWGVAEVENENHCDFVKLREALLRQNIEDLIDKTHNVRYERYREARLNEMGFEDAAYGPEFARIFQQMNDNFIARVEQKEKELKVMEESIKNRTLELQKQHTEDLAKIEDQIQLVDKEMELLKEKLQKKKGTFKRKERVW